ncbi:MAG: HAMP domain-containing protein [Betaproteobacteria bacterium]|nr:MAG: HAMP domain-containing protein [Betaproteobacteria bacterium]
MKFALNLSVGRRLALGFASLVALSLMLAVQSLTEFRAAGSRLHDIVEVNNPKSDLANQLLNEINMLAIQSRSITLLTDVKEIDDELKVMAAAEGRYMKAEQALGDSLAGGAGTDDETKLVKDIVAARTKTLPLFKLAAEQGKNGQNIDATMTLTLQVRPAENVWRQKVADLIRVEAVLNAAALDQARAGQTRAMVGGAVLGSLALALGVVLAWLITRSVTRPIAQAIEVTERIAQGDLTSTLKSTSKDEFGRLLDGVATMQDRLRDLVSQIRQSADSIQVASTEVAHGNADLSARTEQAASNLQQTASSMEQLTGTVKQTADSAHTANQLASSASVVAERGGKVVGQVVSTMNEINSSSKKIADIIGVIDGIAFQTNILALNAAVEAARAGEQGRGFAVVAGEVRSLAQRSAEAAKEIKALIGTSVDKVETGSKLVQDAGTTMNEIVASVQRVSDIIGEITAAASEQSSGIGQVNTAVTQLDQMTQQNAALVEESAAAAASLKEQANKLTSVVSTFRIAATQEAPALAVVAAHGEAHPVAKQAIQRAQQAAAPVVAAPKKAAPPKLTQAAPVAATPAPAAPKPAAPSDDDWETF